MPEHKGYTSRKYGRREVAIEQTDFTTHPTKNQFSFQPDTDEPWKVLNVIPAVNIQSTVAGSNSGMTLFKSNSGSFSTIATIASGASVASPYYTMTPSTFPETTIGTGEVLVGRNRVPDTNLEMGLTVVYELVYSPQAATQTHSTTPIQYTSVF